MQRRRCPHQYCCKWVSYLTVVFSIENDLFWQPYSCGYAGYNLSVSCEALHICVIHTATQIDRYWSLMRTYLCCYGESWRWSPLWRFGSVCCGMAQLFSRQFQSIKLVSLLLLRLFRWNSSRITIDSTENNNIPSNEHFFKNYRQIKKEIYWCEEILTQRVGEFLCGFWFPD